MKPLYHQNMVNVQLSLDFRGSVTPVAVATLVGGC
jgi:hypothetical protein